MSKRPTEERPRADDASPRNASTGRLGRIQDRVLEVVALVSAGTPADRALEQVFRRAKDLGKDERAEVTETAYAWIRRRGRLDDRLARGCKAAGRRFEVIDEPMKHRLRLLALRAELGASLAELLAKDPGAARRVPKLAERLVAGREAPNPHRAGTAKALAYEHAIPEWLAERLLAEFSPERASALASASRHRAPLTLRVNRLRAGLDAVRAALTADGLDVAPTELAPDGLVIRGGAELRDHPLARSGAIEVQDEGSQLIALAVGARPGELVIDACAGAGGKTLAMAAAMQNQGRIVAFDVDEGKLGLLSARARAAGFTNIETHALDFLAIGPEWGRRADRVLLDVPCSGSGVFRRNPDAPWRLDDERVRELAALQVSLLARAAGIVRPGGRVLYATCSIFAEENERVVEAGLGAAPNLEPASLSETLGPLAARLGATHEARLDPAEDPGPDGYYFALLGDATR